MTRLKKLLTTVTASFVAVSLVACSQASNSSKTTTSDSAAKATLNIGAINSVDVVPIVIANEKGFFKKEGVDVKFQPFKSSQDRDTAFQAGNLDGVICDEIAIALYQNSDFDVKITGITNGDFMLIANPQSGIKSINDIKGKSVAISQKTSIEYVLDKMLEKSSMQPADVKKSIVPAVPTRLEMLRNNKVDAALLPEPFSTAAIKDGGILLGTATKMAHYPSVTAFSQKAIDSKKSEIKAFYKAYNDAVEYINSTSISDYEATIIKTVGYPDDMKGKIKLPEFKKNALPSEDEVKSAIDWTVKNGIVKKTLTPKDVMSDVAVK
ncbi:NMT1/THI5-like protein [Clostridiales bacterium oral taxon 876 str. F0540]|nr:NMT1/THI5-like protein [Clostridiales bacterium oral taxon 876 str. F0540]